MKQGNPRAEELLSLRKVLDQDQEDLSPSLSWPRPSPILSPCSPLFQAGWRVRGVAQEMP